MYPPVDPVIISLGPLTLRWYGVLIMTGVMLAAWVGAQHVERRGFDRDSVWDLLFWVLIPGLIGARLYYVFIQSPRGPEGLGRFLAHPASILAVWEGGLHIFGGFIFGTLGLWAFARVRKTPLLVYADAIALGLPLGQAVGRWANFINQELYGPPTTLPWGLRIDADHRIGPYRDLAAFPEMTLFHPLFLYESLWNLIGFALIFSIWRRYGDRLRDGDVLLMYLVWYPLGRFFIEFLRTDSWFFPGTPFNVVHILSFVAVVGAATLLYRRHGGRRAAHGARREVEGAGKPG
ncbi:prolipoprotein diacylglyceryl transferase [Roseiflexus castenholzii]|uniref:prolipoprotein diacylglyceryl transferase n=1 Tax=Roseiflexus castenholzii TaxID=120962 RepID=UPI003C7B8415